MDVVSMLNGNQLHVHALSLNALNITQTQNKSYICNGPSSPTSTSSRISHLTLLTPRTIITELANPTFPRVHDIHAAGISLAAPPGHLVVEVGGEGCRIEEEGSGSDELFLCVFVGGR